MCVVWTLIKMKTFVIIACFVGLVVAEEKAKDWGKMLSECNGNKMPDDDFFAKGANDVDVQKFSKCLFKKLDLLNSDDTFNSNKAKEMFDKFTKGEKSSSFIDDCVEKSKGTTDNGLALAEKALCFRSHMMQSKNSS